MEGRMREFVNFVVRYEAGTTKTTLISLNVGVEMKINVTMAVQRRTTHSQCALLHPWYRPGQDPSGVNEANRVH